MRLTLSFVRCLLLLVAACYGTGLHAQDSGVWDVPRAGGESIAAFRALSEFAGDKLRAAGCGLKRLPVVEKWVLRTAAGADSLLRRYEYGRFGCGGNTLTRPTRVYVQRDGQEASRALISSQRYLSYDSRGRITEMVDARGRRIKARWMDKYYLYDILGNVRVILQPEASAQMNLETKTWKHSDDIIDQYAFINRYDRRGNCIYAKVPGAGPVEMRYDPLNRLAFRRTATMAEQGESEFTLYDPIDRVAVTGIVSLCLPDSSIPKMTATYSPGSDGLDSTGYIAPDGYTQTNARASIVNYYDSYDFATRPGFSSLPTTEFSFEPSHAKGFITGTRLSVETCDDNRSLLRNLNWYTYSKTGYDYEGRPDCCVSSSALSGFYIQTTTGYTRQGHVTETDSKYLTPYSLTYCVGESFSTDALGNPTSQSARLGLKQSGYAERNLSSLKLDIAYNALGKPCRKSTAGNSVTIDYGYNMRGMLSSISSTAFSQSVFYNDGLSPCYNGNISGITNTYGSGTPVAVQFSYDRLNRLTASLSSDVYNTAYSYSLNSSPLTVLRRGLLSDGTVGTVDNLTMTYCGNRLTKTVDSADPVLLENSMDFYAGESACSYDTDGRMTADSGRGITGISYNRIDRPECIEMENGACIFYAYDATGQKLAETYRNGNTTTRYYVGALEMVQSDTDTVPRVERFNLPYGYIKPEEGVYAYIPDYQGNVRAVLGHADTATCRLVERIPSNRLSANGLQ